MRVLSERDVLTLIDRGEAIRLAAVAFEMQAHGGVAVARAALWRDAPKAGALVIAGAGFADGRDLMSVKSNVHAYPDGPGAPRRWGSLLTLWDLATGRPRALLAASAFNEHRTAAGFAAAALRLAPPGAETLAVFGAGRSAPETIRYLAAALPSLGRVLIVGRSPERVAALAARIRTWPDTAHLAVATDRTGAEAADRADVIVTVTTSAEPVFPGAVVRPGTLVILAGANRPDAREADDDLMRRAVVVVDSTENALAKAGDIVLARRSGALGDDRILGEIGGLPDGPFERPDGADIVVFKSTGLAAQDLLLAAHLVEAGERRGLGVAVDLAMELAE